MSRGGGFIRPKAANHDRFPDASRYKDEFLKIGVTGAAPAASS